MANINSIQQFFSFIDCDFQCFDMGRIIRPLDAQTLHELEQTHIPCAAPFLQHIWLAILFWPAQKEPVGNSPERHNSPEQHNVWFLKLPLDEQARLNLAARDEFLHRLLDALNQKPDSSASAGSLNTLENVMQDNPYGFQPRPEQLANFHALAYQHLNLPSSRYYAPAQTFFSGQDHFKHWQALGFQGLADFAAHLNESYQHKSNIQWLSESVSSIPAAPFLALSQCLENHSVSETFCQAVFQRANNELQNHSDSQSTAQLCAASIRATACCACPEQAGYFIRQVLKSSVHNDIEILAIISGRCWPQLKQYETLMPFLESLTQTEHGQQAFNAVLSDLMFIPGMREPVLQAFRSPERSEQLSQAIGTFFSSLQQVRQ